MATKKSKRRRGGGKKSKKDNRSAAVTFTISRACAEELFAALVRTLDDHPNGYGKRFKGGGKGGGFGPLGELPGLDDTEGRD
jgi:hypothetical protein